MVGIIVKKYEHFNSALGKYISSKREYANEMAKGGFVSYEKGREIAEKAKQAKQVPYIQSKKAVDIIKTIYRQKGKKKFVPDGRLIDGMKEVGVKFAPTAPEKLKVNEGGFYTV